MQVLECIFVHYCRLCFHAFPSLNRQKTILCEIDTKTRTQKWGLCGSVAEWSKALDLGSSLSGGVGSNPTTASAFFFSWYMFELGACSVTLAYCLSEPQWPNG